jgi:beta-lactamase regulating signal transducer with metallopeptidase domain
VDHVLNWLWQGCLVAFATAVLLLLLERSRAQARYVIAFVALAAVVLLPVISAALAQAAAPPLLAGNGGPVSTVFSLPSAWWTSTTLVMSLCAAWSGVYALGLAIALHGARRARRSGIPFPADVESHLHTWKAVRGRGRRTRLVLSSDVRTAAVLGCGSPVIAVAPALVERLSERELDRIVIHEWAHVQRRDDVLNLAHVAARVLAGWHPGVWWLERQLRIERESACDEIAVALTGSSKDYAACLTTVATSFPARRQLLATVGALSSPALHTRVVRILSHRHLVSPRRSAIAAIAAVVSIGAVAVALAGRRLVDPAPPGPDVERVLSPAPPARTTSPSTIPVRVTRPTPVSRPRAAIDGKSRRAALERQAGQAAESRTVAGQPTGDEQQPALLQASTPSLLLTHTSVPAVAASGLLSDAPEVAPAGDNRPATPWTAAAHMGIAAGRGSQKAGTATAAFFTRAGKRIAGAF